MYEHVRLPGLTLLRLGLGVMSVLSWLRLAVTLWLLRRAARLAGWLLLAAAAVAAWPVTAVGYTAAWLRGWPAATVTGLAAFAASPSTAECSSYPHKAGVSRVTGILRAAQCNKAPFMYEMKGALSGYGPGSASFPASRLRVRQSPGLTVPDRLVSQLHRSSSTGRPASLFRFAQLPGSPDSRFARLPRFPGMPVRPVTRTPRRHAPPAGARHLR